VQEIDPYKKSLVVSDAAEWIASKTDAQLDDKLVRLLADILKTKEGEALVRFLLLQARGREVDADLLFRGACIALAVVLGAAPYWPSVKDAAGRLVELANEPSRAPDASGDCCPAARPPAGRSIGLLPRLRWPSVSGCQRERGGPERGDAGEGCRRGGGPGEPQSPAERMIWASVWEKAAVVVSAPEGKEAVFTDTRSLRGFTVLSLDIAWRRMAGRQPGDFPGLREGVEQALGGVVGLEVKPVTPELRKAYAEVCRAIAWAGIGRG
jgi:hypothetical protein